jgi:hypothetical protein
VEAVLRGKAARGGEGRTEEGDTPGLSGESGSAQAASGSSAEAGCRRAAGAPGRGGPGAQRGREKVERRHGRKEPEGKTSWRGRGRKAGSTQGELTRARGQAEQSVEEKQCAGRRIRSRGDGAVGEQHSCLWRKSMRTGTCSKRWQEWSAASCRAEHQCSARGGRERGFSQGPICNTEETQGLYGELIFPNDTKT